MKKSLISLFVLIFCISPTAFASDISVFGGRLVDGEGQNSVAVSVGFDVPGGFGLFSPSELRADLGYLFTSFDIPFDAVQDADAASILNTDIGTLTAHAGPAWRINFLNRASVFAGAQLGVAITRTDSEVIGPISQNTDFFDEFTTTNFSYQVPIGFEYSFSRRIGVTSRYRLLGITGRGNALRSHILEAGIIVKF